MAAKKQRKPKKKTKFVAAPCTPTMEPQQFLSILSELSNTNKEIVDVILANRTNVSGLKHPKSRHYITGIHTSSKCPTLVHYRSGWENTAAHFFDVSDEVLLYLYEPFPITYFVLDKKSGRTKIKKYYPDFLCVLNDYSARIIEIKRTDKVNSNKVLQKTVAAEKWAKHLKIKYNVWHDKHLKMCQATIAEKSQKLITNQN